MKRITIFTLGALHCVFAFNLDVSRPMVYTGPEHSYFGYSVDILAVQSGGQDTWIVVGAPRADDARQSGLTQPGVLYRCSSSTTSCWPVVVDDSGNIRKVIPKWKNVTIHHSKNKQWLGATLHVDNVNGKVLVCAPRWKDREYYVQGHEFMNGLCYESGSGLTFNLTSAWPALEYLRKQIHPSGHYVFGMGALGTSAAYAKDGSFLLLGAPGINDWTGGLVLITGDHYSRPHIFEPPRKQFNNSYIGYSVTTARLTSDGQFIVAGAPRADNKGKLFVYDLDFNTMLVKDGYQFGEYFGASVCAVDLNGDMLDEIVVGAPLFSENYDEGRVFVFINEEFFSLVQQFPALSGSNSAGARFGTTVANIGDINRDGFEDLAVGAPYEEDMVGVVYIYNGSPRGMHQTFSQRIVGSDVSRHIRAFGWAFSQPFDVDNNFYPDVAVGAYASDRVVLLSSRPVMDLHVQMSLQPPVIDPRHHANCLYMGAPAQCITPVVCFRYTGAQLNDNIYAEFTMTLDTLERNRNERRRLFVFNQDTGSEDEQFTEVLHMRRGSAICRSDFTVFTRKSRDLITPLQIEVSVTVHEQTNCDLCPVVNKYNPTTVAAQAKFAKDCGADDICQSSLFVHAKAKFSGRDDYLVVDDSASFDIKIDLGNAGETAYQSMLSLTFPDCISFSRLRVLSGASQVACLPQTANGHNDTRVLGCDVEEPVEHGHTLVLFVRFYLIDWSHDLHALNVSVRVTTASEESDLSDNIDVVTIPVRLKSKLYLTGASLPSQLDLPTQGPTYDDDGSAWTHVKHIYEVKNFGPSPFLRGSVVILLPYSRWIHVTNIQVRVENTNADTDTDSEVADACSTSQPSLSPDDVVLNTSQHTAAPSKVVKMACSYGVCTNITCQLPDIHSDSGIYISMNVSVRRDIIKQLKIDKEMHIVSSAQLIEPTYTAFVSLTQVKNASVVTFVNPESITRKSFQMWVLAVSVVSGLLILYVIGAVLWKFGFFKRRKREELQRLMLEAESDRNSEIVNSDDASDVMVIPATTFLNCNQQDINFNHHNHQWSSPGPHPAFSNDTYLEPINMRS